jgi:transcriptional regulator with XRE-family HTH domain
MTSTAGGKRRVTRKFSEIRRPETPERRARIDAIKAGMAAGERLFELRKARGVTQVDVADRLGVSQGNVSELERREDLFLSTLRGYVAALGGHLEVNAVFDEGDSHLIDLQQFAKAAQDAAAAARATIPSSEPERASRSTRGVAETA